MDLIVPSRLLGLSEENYEGILFILLCGIIIPVIYILLAILPMFWLYQILVYVLIQVRFGFNFGGFVKGINLSDSNRNPSKYTKGILVLFEYRPDGMECLDIFGKIKNIVLLGILQNSNTLHKFHSTIISFMGYNCFIKKKLPITKCVKKLPIINKENNQLDKTELMELLSECYQQPFSCNGTCLWDVFVGTQPVKWRQNSKDVEYYPTLFRIHHSIADDIGVLKLLATLFSDHASALAQNKQVNFVKRLDKIVWKICQLFKTYIRALFLIPFLISKSLKLKSKESYILMKSFFTKKEILAFELDEFGMYYEKVKRIKSKIGGITLSDIVMTAFSASLKEYLDKNSPFSPEYLRLSIQLPFNSSVSSLLKMEKINIRSVEMQNNSSFIIIDLPIFLEHKQAKKRSLIYRLKLIKDQTNSPNKFMELKLNHFVKNIVCSCIPSSIINNFAKLHCSATVSYIPSPRKLTFHKGGLVISHCILWTPQQNDTGINFSFSTYNNQLHMGINADQVHINNQHGAEEILKGVYKYLDLLEEEIDN